MALDINKVFDRMLSKQEPKRPPVIRIMATPPWYFHSTNERKVTGEVPARPPRELPPTREVLHVNALKRIDGPMIDVPMVAPRHKQKRWMTDSYHKRIQKKWDKQAKGKTMKVYPTERVILSLSKVAVDKLARAVRLARERGRAAVEDLTIPYSGKFPPLRMSVNKDDSVTFNYHDKQVVATHEDLSAAEWVTLTLQPPKPRKEED